ncbi:hypothetical protein PYCCODRAFT_1472668 [Trametes coccinea BRFM310]|uniref:Uncharacterized protein n=1 Tax=Trametes coccinea (strain BRFM310) TaxID=1353009 RepID=A0A1Y2I904_TRAC3|nr:hypothetical protein PYCCODRAFT_1472668 [Trametes coccinea BRFM310]
MSSNSPDLVDDTNPRVQYQPGWIWDQGVAEVDGTRHGAATSGLECWLSFTGTGVQVVGTLGPSDTDGQPSTAYSVDGVPVGTYNAPVVPSGTTRYNVTFFAARNLSAGDHIIRINNTNGTTPNVFWLDYFLIDGSPQSEAPSPTPFTSQGPSASQSNSSPLTSNGSATSSPSSGAGDVLPSVSGSSSSSRSASHPNIGAIVGGVVGGVVVVAIIAALLYCLMRERRRAARVQGIVPFETSQDHSEVSSPGSNGRRGSAGLVSSKESSRSMTEYSGTASPSSPIPSVFAITGNRSLAVQPSEPAPTSIASQPSSRSSRGAFTAMDASTPSRPTPSSPLSSAEKAGSSLRQATTPSLSSTSGPMGTGDSSPMSSAHPTPASALFPADYPLVPPAAAVPPGVWHAPPTMHSRAQSLLQSFFSRGPRTHDVDSGLRLFDPVVEPPPYTQD